MGTLKDDSLKQYAKFLRYLISYYELTHDEISVINTCNKILEINAKDDFVYVKRGFYHNLLKNTDSAISDYSTAINLGTKVIEAYINRGFIYFTQKKYNPALADYSDAISIDSTSIRAYANRALCYYTINDFNKSLKDLYVCRRLDPNHQPFIEGIKEIESKLKDKNFNKSQEQP